MPWEEEASLGEATTEEGTAEQAMEMTTRASVQGMLDAAEWSGGRVTLAPVVRGLVASIVTTRYDVAPAFGLAVDQLYGSKGGDLSGRVAFFDSFLMEDQSAEVRGLFREHMEAALTGSEEASTRGAGAGAGAVG